MLRLVVGQHKDRQGRELKGEPQAAGHTDDPAASAQAAEHTADLAGSAAVHWWCTVITAPLQLQCVHEVIQDWS